MGGHGKDACGTCGGKGTIEVPVNGKKGNETRTETCGGCGGSGEK